MRRILQLSLIAPVALLAACTTIPEGPSVMALPGTGKTFDQFRLDDADCRQFAMVQIGGQSPNQTATSATVSSAAVGAAVGALAGAAIGDHHSAGVGAGTGLVVGTMAGAGSGQASGYGAQRRYDIAYIQCMYAKGTQVPVSGRFTTGAPRSSYPPPPPPPPR